MNMQLLVFVLTKTELLGKILSRLLEENFHGATVLESKGMFQVLNQMSDDAPPIFGSLRQFITPDHVTSKTLFIVLREDQIEKVSGIINEVTGGLEKPGTGILFTLPVLKAEGLGA